MELRNQTPAINLPNEIWIEIFKNVDNPNLLKLCLVCKHWNGLIFKYLVHRFQLSLDAVKMEQLSKKGIRMAADRSYRHLQLTLPMLNCSPKPMKILRRVAPNLEALRLNLETLDIKVLLRLLQLCPRVQELTIKGVNLILDVFALIDLLNEAVLIVNGVTSLDVDHPLKVIGKTFEPCVVENSVPEVLNEGTIFPAIRSLGLDLTDLDQYQRTFLHCFPNVTELEIVASQADLGVIGAMANRLKVLKVKLLQDAVSTFLTLRLPALEVLALKVNGDIEKRALMHFLLGSKLLKTAIFTFHRTDDVFPVLAASLPMVERLQISGQTSTALIGLEKMIHLKELALKGCCLRPTFIYFALPVTYSVKKLECIGVMTEDRVGELLYRCQFIRSLTLSVRNVHDMSHYAECMQCLEDFTLLIDRVYPTIINQMHEMLSLERLVIKAKLFSKTNFKLLHKVMALPTMKSLTVTVTEGLIPRYVARKVASANRACSLVLNGERIDALPLLVRSTGRKRKVASVAVVSEATN
ncbi:uncharacterized protein LOC109433514 [Aedes albopictus]|uniref:F-box domain-containing protein n=1 Tax=Aedes albopictus TaxID=7160 RepID=A0ABM1YG59_AEDAL|nr:uncharacterized protein LOC109433514 [Aedes albopictus]